MNALIQSLAAAFVHTYELLCDSIGQLAALLDSRVQAAWALYLAARADASAELFAEAA